MLELNLPEHCWLQREASVVDQDSKRWGINLLSLISEKSQRYYSNFSNYTFTIVLMCSSSLVVSSQTKKMSPKFKSKLLIHELSSAWAKESLSALLLLTACLMSGGIDMHVVCRDCVYSLKIYVAAPHKSRQTGSFWKFFCIKCIRWLFLLFFCYYFCTYIPVTMGFRWNSKALA